MVKNIREQFTYLLLVFVYLTLFAFIGNFGKLEISKSIKTIFIFMAMICAFSILIFLFKKRHAKAFKFSNEIISMKKRSSIVLAMLALTGGVALVSLSVGLIWCGHHLNFDHYNNQNDYYLKHSRLVNRFKLFNVFIHTLSPLVEEFIFRKCMLTLLLKNSVPLASAIVSLLFAGYQNPSSWLKFLLLFLFSLELNYLYQKSGRLIYPILLHLSLNIFIFYFTPDWSEPVTKEPEMTIFFIVILFFSLTLILILNYYASFFSRKNSIVLKKSIRNSAFVRSVYGFTGTLILLQLSGMVFQ